jgi:membrane protein required for colicin V production
MELTTIDFVIIGLILFLSIKGIVTGFTRELLNFVGLVGGIALASRVSLEVGNIINNNLYPIESDPTLKLTGFIVTLLVVWILFSLISSIMNKIMSDYVSIFSALLGYMMTALRYIAIFSLILIGIQKSDFLSEKLSEHYANSKLLPLFIEVGEDLLNEDKNRTKESNVTKSRDINLSAIDFKPLPLRTGI